MLKVTTAVTPPAPKPLVLKKAEAPSAPLTQATPRPRATPGAGDSFQPAGATAQAPQTVRGNAHFHISAQEVQRARAKNDPAATARVLHALTSDRSNLLLPNDATRLERTRELLAGMSARDVDAVRSAYLSQFGRDPETDLRGWDFFQPLARLDDDLQLEMVASLNGPQLKETASTLAGLLDKARRGTLTPQDRQTYYATLPMVGLWNPPLRPDAAGLDSMERKILTRMWGAQGADLSLDAALKTIEAKLPPADLAPKAPREKSVAVVVSSAGAQWQELMDWAKVMDEKGYHIQLFTPDGRPAAFQHDSMTVCKTTSRVGHGCPPHLDPRGPTGDLARKLLAHTAGAAQFNPEHFGAVFSAGGLGFNEDVVVARPVKGQDGRTRTELTNNPNIDKMMRAAVDARLPNISICHGPTVLAATKMRINGREEAVNAGIQTASLPPFEGYVGLTRRKEPQFTYDVNTHNALEAAGGDTSVLKDIAKMSRVVHARKDGMDVLSGPGPQAARNLGLATVEVMQQRWR